MSETGTPHLLLAYDGSTAAAEAIAAAGRLVPGARATVVTVRDSWLALEHAAMARIAIPDSILVPAVHEYEADAESGARRVAEEGRALAVAAGLDAKCRVQPADTPSRGLCDAASDLHADAIVCGASGHGGVFRGVLGTTTGHLLHHAPLPVLIVPSRDERADGPLLIGYDGSAHAREAIRTAGRLFAGRRALVAHAWSTPMEHSYAGSALLAAPVDEVHDVAQSLADMFMAQAADLVEEGAALAADAGLLAEPLDLRSTRSAWRALEAAAREHRAAVIVAGCRGRGAVASTVLGSVSSGLAHNATVPVLIVRRPSDDLRHHRDEQRADARG
jgi:nucleotide-binding universal stress UspA family protein